MAYSEAQKKATMKYLKNNKDEIKIRVPKGEKERYQKHAADRGKSLTALIVELLEDDICKTQKAPKNAYKS